MADEGRRSADGGAPRGVALSWTDAPQRPPAWPAPLAAAVEFALALPMPAAVVWTLANAAIANASLARVGGFGARAGWPGDEVLAAAATGDVPTAPGWSFLPLRDADGLVAGVLAAAVGSAATADLAELQHQSRNAIAWVRSIAKRTAATSNDLDDYVMHLDGRIDAVARVRAAAALQPDGVDLAQLVSAELVALAVQDDAAVSIGGPDVMIAPRPAETVALALHELATNAVKFGALSVPDGHLAVYWTADTDGVVIRWRETGVPGPLSQSRSGFGMEVLEKTLPYELGALTRFWFEAGGACCILALPASTVAVPRS